MKDWNEAGNKNKIVDFILINGNEWSGNSGFQSGMRINETRKNDCRNQCRNQLMKWRMKLMD